jgi:hypothetical protein
MSGSSLIFLTPLNRNDVNAFEVCFGPSEREELERYASCTDRELFYYLINIEEFPDALPTAMKIVRKYLSCTRRLCSDSKDIQSVFRFFTYSPDELEQRLAAIKGGCEISRLQASIARLNRAQYVHIIRQFAPTALIDGCWLQNIANMATASTEISAHLFRLYKHKLGDGQLALNQSNIYRALLHSLSIDMPEVSSQSFIRQQELLSSAFTVPVFELSLSQFPRIFLPEILGYTFGHYFGISEFYNFISLTHLESLGINPAFFELCIAYDNTKEQINTAKTAVHLYLQHIRQTATQSAFHFYWQRIWTGFLVQRIAEADLCQQLHQYLNTTASISPRQRVLDIIKKKLPYARGHHRTATLGDKKIEEWFARDNHDIEAFLDAFAKSAYICPDDPENSRFFTELLTFGGPMFKTFTKEESDAVLEWIRTLQTDINNRELPKITTIEGHLSYLSSTPQNDHLEMLWRDASSTARAADTAAKIRKYTNKTKKELYYYLVNVDIYPDVLPIARALVHEQLSKTESELARKRISSDLKFFQYSHPAFENRIHSIYESAVNSYTPFTPPPRFSREEYIWALAQVAPIILVDGCWVQNIANAATVYTHIIASLFSIFSDEIGNGHTKLHHGNVYRTLLKGLRIEAADTASYEFVAQPGLSDAIFELPVFLLAISQFPRTFLPEIIGVNLAIELSGLGEFYMTLVDEMRYWELDPTIVMLHISSDNLASGHAAIARDVVLFYLDHVQANYGHEEMQRHWKRIWTGYVALRVVPKRAWMTLAIKFLAKFGMQRVKKALSASRLVRMVTPKGV